MAKSSKKTNNIEIKKPPLSYTLLSVSPYDGAIVYSIEARPLITTVLLNDLRTLYEKVIPSEVKLLGNSQLNSLNRLATICPEHYKRIFKKKRDILNIDLLKTEYPEEFHFINKTGLNIITIEEYKTKYISIIRRLNSAVRTLSNINEKILIYNSEKIDVAQNTYELVIKSVIKLEKTRHRKQKSEKQNEIPVGNENENKPQIPKFIWHKSFEHLKNLFKDLFGTYIDRVNVDLLLQHFLIKNETSSRLPTETFKELNWKAELNELAFFIYKLKHYGLISHHGVGVHVMTVMHFTVGQNKTTPNRLSSSLKTVKNLELDNELPHKYIDLENIIKKQRR